MATPTTVTSIPTPLPVLTLDTIRQQATRATDAYRQLKALGASTAALIARTPPAGTQWDPGRAADLRAAAAAEALTIAEPALRLIGDLLPQRRRFTVRAVLARARFVGVTPAGEVDLPSELVAARQRDAQLEELTRIRWALTLPQMSTDALQSAWDDVVAARQYAVLAAIVREAEHRAAHPDASADDRDFAQACARAVNELDVPEAEAAAAVFDELAWLRDAIDLAVNAVASGDDGLWVRAEERKALAAQGVTGGSFVLTEHRTLAPAGGDTGYAPAA